MRVFYWLLTLGVCFFSFTSSTDALIRCERLFVGQVKNSPEVFNPPNFQEASSFRTNHFSIYYPEAYNRKDDSVFNRTLVSEKKGIASKEDRWLFTFDNPILSGIFVIPEDEKYLNYQLVGPREFALDQFTLQSPNGSLSVVVDSSPSLHEISVEVPEQFPSERVHLSLTNYLRQIDFTETSFSQIDYNYLSPEGQYHLSFFDWSRLAKEPGEASNAEFEAMWRHVETEYRSRVRNLPDDYLQRILGIGRRLADRSFSVVNKSSKGIEGEVNGAMTLVRSDHPEDPLFFEAIEMELFKKENPSATNEEIQTHLKEKFELDRRPGVAFFEMGRLAVKKGDKTGISPMIMQNLAAIAMGMGAKELHAYVDRAHKSLYDPFGFKVHKEVDGYGRTYWVLKADARVAYYRAVAINSAIAAGNDELIENLIAQGIRMARVPGQDIIADVLDGFSGVYPETLPDSSIVRERVADEVNRDRWESGLSPLPGTLFDVEKYEHERLEEQARIELMFMEGPELLQRLQGLGFFN